MEGVLKKLLASTGQKSGIIYNDFQEATSAIVDLDLGVEQSDRIIIIGGYVNTPSIGYPTDIKVDGVSMDVVDYTTNIGTAGTIYGVMALPSGTSATVTIQATSSIDRILLACWSTYGSYIDGDTVDVFQYETSGGTTGTEPCGAGTVACITGFTEYTGTLTTDSPTINIDANNEVTETGYADIGHTENPDVDTDATLTQGTSGYLLLYGASFT